MMKINRKVSSASRVVFEESSEAVNLCNDCEKKHAHKLVVQSFFLSVFCLLEVMKNAQVKSFIDTDEIFLSPLSSKIDSIYLFSFFSCGREYLVRGVKSWGTRDRKKVR